MPNPVLYSPDVESREEGEAETSRELNETLHQILETTSKDYGHAVRSVHAKSHALLEGELTVAGDLLPTLAQGLFAEAGSYKAVLRLSTIPGDMLDDSVSVPRGIALKILGVEGERLEGSEGDGTQDFIFVDGPAFGSPSAKHFLGNLKLLAKTTDRIEGIKKLQSALFRAIEGAVEAVGGKSATLSQLGGHPATNPLGATYYSQTAFRYGDYIAKLSLVPISGNLTALEDEKIKLAGRPNALREEIAPEIARAGGVWELRVQLCTDLEKMPVEDPSKAWDEEESPWHTIGRIEVKPQTSWSEARSKAVDDGLAFSVWTGLAAHRPLGVINRVRKPAYKMSADFRGNFNGCPIHEPRSLSLDA